MNAVVQNFIGTTEEWETENPILYEAVWGFEKTTEGKLLAKVGDGVSTWNDLKYFDEYQSQRIKELETRINILEDQLGIDHSEIESEIEETDNEAQETEE